MKLNIETTNPAFEEFKRLVAEIKRSDYLDALHKARESWYKFEGVVDGGTLIRLER